ALSDYSIQAWRAWAAELPEDCAYRGCGTLWLAADAAELAEAERKRQALLASGVACEMLDAARLRDLEPVLRPGLAGALKVPGDGILYAPNAARWLLERAGPRLRRLHAEVSEVDGSRLRLADACEMLDAARLRDLEPVLRPGLAGALKVPGDGILYAPNAARWLLERAGPRLRRLHAEVSEVDGSRLRLADGRWLSAEALVLDSRRGGATAVGMGHLVAMDDNPAELALSDYSIQA
uniref:FAD-dependent oxidoreductase n=1 Tax=Pseudomonas aeruginosa TaxID=287 RepID=UPI0024416889